MTRKLKFEMLYPGDIVGAGEQEYVVLKATPTILVGARVVPGDGQTNYVDAVCWGPQGQFAGWEGGTWNVYAGEDPVDRIVQFGSRRSYGPDACWVEETP